MRSHGFIPLLLLAGCTTSLQELQEISPVASNFSSSLAAEYLAYSESEAEQGREREAEYFADKGVKAARGIAVEPDAVNEKANNFQLLTSSRAALQDILRDDVERVAPQKAARAQLLFDCWNQKENDGLPHDKLPVVGASCAKEFSLVYNELKAVADNLIHGASGKYTLQFAMDSAELDAEAEDIIAKIARHIAGHPDYALELNAHHDANDKKTAQGHLAHKRLISARAALVKAGVPKRKIVFVKPVLAGKPDRAVYLSNDEIVQDNDEVDIVITSSRHLSLGTP